MADDSSQTASGSIQGVEYAGFWARFVALLVDGAILVAIVLTIGIASTFAGAAGIAIGQIIIFLVYLLYWPVMESSSRQATFGKSLLGLQVTDLNGDRLSFLRAFLRNLAKIISAIPFDIGFIMAAFTGRKQALHDMITKCLVVRTRPSHFGRVLATGFGALVLVIGGSIAYFYYVAVPQMQEQTAASMQAAVKHAPPKKAMPARPTVANKPMPATTAKAEPRMQGAAPALTGFDKPGSVRAGPAILTLDQFFPTSIWIKVQLPLIKDLELAPAPEITVSDVMNKSGQNFHDAASPFETGIFLRARLSQQPMPVPHFSGLRTLHIKSGLDEKALQKIDGELRISIPVDARPVAFEAADIGKEKPAHTSTVALKSLSGAEAVLHYRGTPANLLRVRGYAKDGAAVASGWSQSPPAGKAADVDLKFKFKAPVSKVEAVVAAGLNEQKYPFSLAPGSMAGSPSPAMAPAKSSTPMPVAESEARHPAVAVTPHATAATGKPAGPAREMLATASAKPAAAAASKPAAVSTPAPAPAARMERKPRTVSARPRLPKAAASPAPVVAAAPAYEPKVISPKFNDVMTAVIYEDEPAVKQLLDLGWWVDKPSTVGFTPLMAAVMRRNTRIAQLLLARGADPNASGPEGVTPLSLARERDDSATTALLVRQGAH
ncbi:MAG: RDD family protein [Burkholderiales bacterium]|nr:RDD family protein [Burkholderiales bacterium]